MPAIRTCSIPLCTRPRRYAAYGGVCQGHYIRAHRGKEDWRTPVTPRTTGCELLLRNHLSVPPDVKATIERFAEALGISVREATIRALWEWSLSRNADLRPASPT
jgi:hypothetical protein